MPLSPAQLTTLKAAILAETDAEFVGYRTAGATGAMADWLNLPKAPAENAWISEVDRRTLDESADYSIFDSVVAGKRDAWALYLQGAPRDMRRNKARKVVLDCWGNSNTSATVSFAILTASVRPITRAENILGGAATASEGSGSGTITARRLTWEGRLTSDDVIAALGA